MKRSACWQTDQFVRNCKHCSAASYGCCCCCLSYTSSYPQVHTCSSWNASCTSNTLFDKNTVSVTSMIFGRLAQIALMNNCSLFLLQFFELHFVDCLHHEICQSWTVQCWSWTATSKWKEWLRENRWMTGRFVLLTIACLFFHSLQLFVPNALNGPLGVRKQWGRSYSMQWQQFGLSTVQLLIGAVIGPACDHVCQVGSKY